MEPLDLSDPIELQAAINLECARHEANYGWQLPVNLGDIAQAITSKVGVVVIVQFHPENTISRPMRIVGYPLPKVTA